MAHFLEDSAGSHSEHCRCFDCWCAVQIARVERTAGKGVKARQQRRVAELTAAHDDMVMAPFGYACLPSLEYYDNRKPRGEQ